MSEIATIRILGIEDPDVALQGLPVPFAAEFARIDAARDCYDGCWSCGTPVGWVLRDESSATGVLDWISLWLAVEDGPVAALCEGCAPDVPAKPVNDRPGGAR